MQRIIKQIKYDRINKDEFFKQDSQSPIPPEEQANFSKLN